MIQSLKTFTVTGANTFNVYSSDPYDLILLTANISIVLLGDLNVNFVGSPARGQAYTFYYEVDVIHNNHDINIFGVTLDRRYYRKNLVVEMFYDGVDWEMKLLPNFINTDIVFADQIAATSLSNLAHNAAIANASSPNAVGDQVLLSLLIPGSSLYTIGDRLYFEAWGTSTAVDAGTRYFKVKTRQGATTDLIFNGTAMATMQKEFTLSGTIMATDIANGHYRSRSSLVANTVTDNDNVQLTGPARYNFASNMYLDFISEEVAPVGGRIVLQGAFVDNIKA